MPSIVIKSSAFAASGLALNSQDVTEESSGLINVKMVFTTTAEKNSTVSRLFYLDAPPPIFPRGVNQEELQSRRLYMINRSFSQANGMVEIAANYAGALSRSLSVPYISMAREIKSVQLRGVASTIIGRSYAVVYDTYTIGVTAAVKSYQYAQFGSSAYNIVAPQSAELLSGAYFIRRQLDPGVVNTGGVDRILSAESLLSKYAKFSVDKDISSTSITPSIMVESTRFFLTAFSNI